MRIAFHMRAFKGDPIAILRVLIMDTDRTSGDADIAQAWYRASQVIKKDRTYCASVREVVDAVVRGESQVLYERIDEVYGCFSTLVRNWRKARNWIHQNEKTDRVSHSRFIGELNALAKILRERGCLQSVSRTTIEEARIDLDYYEFKRSKVDFSHLSSVAVASRK